MEYPKKAVVTIPAERIERSILLIRGHKVMLDRDLAILYGVSPKVLNQSVKRNRRRFPPDFMFQLDAGEIGNLMSQFVTSSWGGPRYLPYAFTEQGVSMLSSVLRSTRAIDVNIEIVRTFVRLRRFLETHKVLSRRLDELEKRHEARFEVIFEAIRQLSTPPIPRRRPIGFRTSGEH